MTAPLSLVPGGTDSLAHLQLDDEATAAAQARADAISFLEREGFDDWTQEVGGIGSFRDRQVGVSFEERKPLTRRVRDALYKQNAFAARVVDLIVDEALMEGWEFEYVEGCTGLAALHERVQCELALDEKLAEAGKWSRKDGFALLTVPTDADPQMPIGLQRPTTVYPIAVEPEQSVIPSRTDDTLGSPTYRKTTYYQVTTFGGETIEMHRSHCVPFEPIKLPVETLLESASNNGKGPSVLDRLYDQLSRYGASQSFANAMLYVASLIVLQFEGYATDFRKPGGRALLQKKAQRMRAQMDALGVLFLDAKDKIANVSHALTGVVDILDRIVQMLAAASDMPREILLNESPNGLRGGELSGAQEIWHKKIRAYQQRVLGPAIRHVLAIAFRIWGYGGADGTKFRIKWRDLWTPTPAAEAETSLKIAQADEIAYNVGSVNADEIRDNRFVVGNRGPLRVKAPVVAAPFDLTAPIEPDASEALTPADEAMNGAQIASLVTIMTSLNQGLLTYTQAVGAIGVAFPSLQGRAHLVLGPPSAVAPPVPAAPAAPAGPPPSNAPEPGDAVSPLDAARAYGFKSSAPIKRAMANGDLQWWGLGNRKRVSLAEVKAYAERHREQASEEPTEPEEPEV